MSRFIVFLSVLLAIRLITFYLFTPQTLPNQSIPKNQPTQATIFTGIKDHIKSSYSDVLTAKNSALLMGIVFGDKELDYNSNKKFAVTGVLHVVAASGMNVSMLTSFVLAFLFLFLKRQRALLTTAAIILFYVALADFQPSIIRAAIMAYFALGAGVYGRQNTSVLALFFTAFGMIFWDPTVLTSISFLLSFSATLGIVLLDPIMKQTVLKGSAFEDFRTTLSAQIATTPILLFYFGTYSPISIVTNLLVLWTIPPLMVLGGLAAIFSGVSQLIAAPFIYLCLPLLTYFWKVVDYFATSFTPVTIKNFPFALAAGYYLILSAVIFWAKKNKTIDNTKGK